MHGLIGEDDHVISLIEMSKKCNMYRKFNFYSKNKFIGKNMCPYVTFILNYYLIAPIYGAPFDYSNHVRAVIKSEQNTVPFPRSFKRKF
jgi:hypothetical protein